MYVVAGHAARMRLKLPAINTAALLQKFCSDLGIPLVDTSSSNTPSSRLLFTLSFMESRVSQKYLVKDIEHSIVPQSKQA